MMRGGGETVEPRPGHSGGLGKPGGDEYPITRNICVEYLFGWVNILVTRNIFEEYSFGGISYHQKYLW